MSNSVLQDLAIEKAIAADGSGHLGDTLTDDLRTLHAAVCKPYNTSREARLRGLDAQRPELKQALDVLRTRAAQVPSSERSEPSALLVLLAAYQAWTGTSFLARCYATPDWFRARVRGIVGEELDLHTAIATRVAATSWLLGGDVDAVRRTMKSPTLRMEEQLRAGETATVSDSLDALWGVVSDDAIWIGADIAASIYEMRAIWPQAGSIAIDLWKKTADKLLASYGTFVTPTVRVVEVLRLLIEAPPAARLDLASHLEELGMDGPRQPQAKLAISAIRAAKLSTVTNTKGDLEDQDLLQLRTLLLCLLNTPSGEEFALEQEFQNALDAVLDQIRTTLRESAHVTSTDDAVRGWQERRKKQAAVLREEVRAFLHDRPRRLSFAPFPLSVRAALYVKAGVAELDEYQAWLEALPTQRARLEAYQGLPVSVQASLQSELDLSAFSGSPSITRALLDDAVDVALALAARSKTEAPTAEGAWDLDTGAKKSQVRLLSWKAEALAEEEALDTDTVAAAVFEQLLTPSLDVRNDLLNTQYKRAIRKVHRRFWYTSQSSDDIRRASDIELLARHRRADGKWSTIHSPKTWAIAARWRWVDEARKGYALDGVALDAFQLARCCLARRVAEELDLPFEESLTTSSGSLAYVFDLWAEQEAAVASSGQPFSQQSWMRDQILGTPSVVEGLEWMEILALRGRLEALVSERESWSGLGLPGSWTDFALTSGTELDHHLARLDVLLARVWENEAPIKVWLPQILAEFAEASLSRDLYVKGRKQVADLAVGVAGTAVAMLITVGTGFIGAPLGASILAASVGAGSAAVLGRVATEGYREVTFSQGAYDFSQAAVEGLVDAGSAGVLKLGKAWAISRGLGAGAGDVLKAGGGATSSAFTESAVRVGENALEGVLGGGASAAFETLLDEQTYRQAWQTTLHAFGRRFALAAGLGAAFGAGFGAVFEFATPAQRLSAQAYERAARDAGLLQPLGQMTPQQRQRLLELALDDSKDRTEKVRILDEDFGVPTASFPGVLALFFDRIEALQQPLDMAWSELQDELMRLYPTMIVDPTTRVRMTSVEESSVNAELTARLGFDPKRTDADSIVAFDTPDGNDLAGTSGSYTGIEVLLSATAATERLREELVHIVQILAGTAEGKKLLDALKLSTLERWPDLPMWSDTGHSKLRSIEAYYKVELETSKAIEHMYGRRAPEGLTDEQMISLTTAKERIEHYEELIEDLDELKGKSDTEIREGLEELGVDVDSVPFLNGRKPRPGRLTTISPERRAAYDTYNEGLPRINGRKVIIPAIDDPNFDPVTRRYTFPEGSEARRIAEEQFGQVYVQYSIEGEPDFSPFQHSTVKRAFVNQGGVVKISGFSSNRAANMKAFRDKVRSVLGRKWPTGARSSAGWAPEGMTWHETREGHGILLSSAIHRACPHTGGVAVQKELGN